MERSDLNFFGGLIVVAAIGFYFYKNNQSFADAVNKALEGKNPFGQTKGAEVTETTETTETRRDGVPVTKQTNRIPKPTGPTSDVHIIDNNVDITNRDIDLRDQVWLQEPSSYSIPEYGNLDREYYYDEPAYRDETTSIYENNEPIPMEFERALI